MAVNKVVRNDGTTIIDITSTTATASDVVEGKRFFAADGTEQVGTAVIGGGSAISVVDTTDSHGGTIRTITAVDLSADTVTAATLLQGYRAHDRLGNAIVGTASGGGGNDFIITLTQNASTGVWEPDCTFAEAQAAYVAGKTVVFVASYYPCVSDYIDGQNPFIYYGVDVAENDFVSTYTCTQYGYQWYSSGVVAQDPYVFYDTGNSDAVPADVASGKVFYNANGYQVGTATAPTLVTKNITANGTYNASSDSADGYSSVTVSVPTPTPSLQTKSKTYTPTESQQTETVTADSNYDGLSQVSITVNAVSSTYVGTGITRQAAKTVTPTKSSQTAVASGVYTTGVITVSAIPAQYITTTDATATAAQINDGATAYVNGVKVTGTQVIQHYYIGSSDPSASTGANGDIYLKVVT